MKGAYIIKSNFLWCTPLLRFIMELNYSGKGRHMNQSGKNDGITAPGAVVVGDVSIGRNSSIWYNAVLRGDEGPIIIGEETNVQDCCVIHTSKNYPVVIGDRVTIGHGAIVHGCKIGDNALIGMGAIILNGAKIGRNCLIAAGSLVTQNMEIPDGMLVMGSPAKIKRALTEEEILKNKENALDYVKAALQFKG